MMIDTYVRSLSKVVHPVADTNTMTTSMRYIIQLSKGCAAHLWVDVTNMPLVSLIVYHVEGHRCISLS